MAKQNRAGIGPAVALLQGELIARQNELIEAMRTILKLELICSQQAAALAVYQGSEPVATAAVPTPAPTPKAAPSPRRGRAQAAPPEPPDNVDRGTANPTER